MATKHVDETTKLIDDMIASLKLTVKDNASIFTEEDVKHINRKIETLILHKRMYVKLVMRDIKSNMPRKHSTFLLNIRKTLDILNSI